jgi:alkanesulfonate monooxygenase SsuD/methylene tetrahydromethanopterin reductase-like flavin-dependent oxidoreductase (luciferase family)
MPPVPLLGSLRVGIQLPEVERTVHWAEYLHLARHAEDLGFDSLWVGDHYLYRDDGRPERGPHEAWTLLAALAASTSRITLGPLVACTAFHPPAVLAKMAATINNISDGRFIFGLGAGWNEPEFRAFGIPFDYRASRFEEAFTIIGSLGRAERCTFHGRFYDLDDAVLLPPPAQPTTLMIGSIGDRVLQAALPQVDWWNTWYDWYGNTIDGFTELNARITTMVVATGRRPESVKRSACVLVDVDPTATERITTGDLRAVDLAELPAHLDALAKVGADEAIIVANPINASSMSMIAETLNSANT